MSSLTLSLPTRSKRPRRIIVVCPRLLMRLESMKEALEGSWNRIVQGNINKQEMTALSEDIQGGIFNNRKQNPLIFDWLADRLRPANEETTRTTVEQYVAEFKAAHPDHYK
jgi:hypothetical protein